METSWVVLKTHPRHELQAASAVAARGVEAYCPRQPPGRRSPERVQPLFPGYLFAHVVPGRDDLLRIRSAPGVAYVLPRNAPPALLPDELILALRGRAAQPPRQLGRGDRVTIVTGPLRWVEAVFDRRLNAAGRVRVLLELVERTLPVDLDEGCVRLVHPAHDEFRTLGTRSDRATPRRSTSAAVDQSTHRLLRLAPGEPYRGPRTLRGMPA
jgi:transcriptional antiterminator RfaH